MENPAHANPEQKILLECTIFELKSPVFMIMLFERMGSF